MMESFTNGRLPAPGSGGHHGAMTYDLYIGDRTFSSWSLRGWLLFEKFDIACRTTLVGLYTGTMAQDLAALAPARLVPTIRTPDGDALQDTLAIAETLAERHPAAGLWPADASARVLARWLAAEMHSGFGALRSECPMNLGTSYAGFTVSDAVRADLDRIETLWATARARFGAGGPVALWHLFGGRRVLRARGGADCRLWPAGFGRRTGLCGRASGRSGVSALAGDGADQIL